MYISAPTALGSHFLCLYACDGGQTALSVPTTSARRTFLSVCQHSLCTDSSNQQLELLCLMDLNLIAKLTFVFMHITHHQVRCTHWCHRHFCNPKTTFSKPDESQTGHEATSEEEISKQEILKISNLRKPTDQLRKKAFTGLWHLKVSFVRKDPEFEDSNSVYNESWDLHPIVCFWLLNPQKIEQA